MFSRSREVKNLMIKAIALAAFLLSCGGTSYAVLEPVPCDPKMGITTIGEEWIAKTCVPLTISDNTEVLYETNLLTCDQSGKVVRLASYGDDTVAPWALESYATGISAGNEFYKIFRNREGTHFVLVHPGFTGEFGGKDMTEYVGGDVNVDIFTRGLILPLTPNCLGAQFNDPNDPNDGPNGPNGPNGPDGPDGPPGPNPSYDGGPHGPDSPEAPPPCVDPCTCGPNTEQKGLSTVNLGTGRLSHSQHLFSINTGTTLNFSLFLNYRSEPFAPSGIGNGWSHSYEMSLQPGADDSVAFWMNGKQRLYTVHGGAFSAPKGDYSSLDKNADGTFILTEKDGLRRYFSADGVATSVSDRFGNSLVFANSGGMLQSVTDRNGRSVRFTYNSGKLSSILDPSDKVYALEYNNGSLARLRLPGGDEWNYVYNSENGLLQQKTDPRQQTSGYLYQGKAVTSISSPSGGALSYSSGSSSAALPGKVPDQTIEQQRVVNILTGMSDPFTVSFQC